VNVDSLKRRTKPARALRTQLRETVRTQILDAAEELIAARGLHGAALAQIARRAGVAVGTLYNYFTDREALVRALFETRRETLYPRLQLVIASGKRLPFEPRLRGFVRGVLEAFDAHRRFIKVALEAEHLKAPSTTASDLQVAIDDIMRAGVAERIIDRDRGVVASFVLAGAIRSVVHRRTAEGSPFVDDADTLVELFLHGVCRSP
jgi:AcrR family transcriptional regulator